MTALVVLVGASLAACGEPPSQYPERPATTTSHPGSPRGAAGSTEPILSDAMPEAGDWDELGVDVPEGAVGALPEVELAPPESVPDPCDSSGETKLAGAPTWTEGRSGVAELELPGASLRLTHRIWRFESPAEAEEALALVEVRAQSCGPVSRGAEWNESFVPAPDPRPRHVRYRWDIEVEDVARRVSVGWTSERSSLVMVEVLSLAGPTEPDVETALGVVAGRVLSQEVRLAMLPPSEDQDA